LSFGESPLNDLKKSNRTVAEKIPVVDVAFYGKLSGPVFQQAVFQLTSNKQSNQEKFLMMSYYPKQRSVISHLIFCILVLLPLQAFADGPIDCGTTPIRVGYFKLGYRFYVDNGQEKGMNVDIMEELRKRTGCTFVTQEMSFARIWEDLTSGELDISLSGIRSPERELTVWFAPSITSKNYVLIGAAARSSVKNADDFFNNTALIFGVARGYTHSKELDIWLQKLRDAGRVEESSNVDVLFEKLKLGRIDGMFSFPFVYRKLLSDLNMQDDVSIQDWFSDDKGIIGCTMLSKKRFSETEANRWRSLILEMQRDGTLKRIFNQYVTPDEADQMLNF